MVKPSVFKGFKALFRYTVPGVFVFFAFFVFDPQKNLFLVVFAQKNTCFAHIFAVFGNSPTFLRFTIRV